MTKPGPKPRAIRERLLERKVINESTGCWEWTGYINPAGYGYMSVGGRARLVHRIAFEEFVRPIPEGLFCCHTCDRPICFNPSHIFLGTHTDNMKDKVAKGRHHNQQVTQCRAGHDYDAANVYVKTDGSRGCRTCKRDADRLQKQRKRQQAKVLEEAKLRGLLLESESHCL